MDFENFPLTKLVNVLSNEAGHTITFDDLREELQKRDENDNAYYHINLKEDNDLGMLYYNDVPKSKLVEPKVEAEDVLLIAPTAVENQNQIEELQQCCRSLIVDKETLKPVTSQFNKILYNNDALEFLKDVSWENVSVQKCYEGTMLLLFNHNDKWYLSTRRCLDAGESIWVKNKSYKEMFEESVGNNFSYDDLDKNLCYQFVLVHYQNKNIVSYNYLGKEYKELYHILTLEKYTFKEVDYKIDGVNYVETENFDSLEQVCDKLEEISEQDEQQERISTEGYVIRAYSTGDKVAQLEPFTVLKLQTNIYQRIMKMKPNNSNLHQSYLELYQKDKLIEFLPYFTKFNGDIVKRIHTAMKNMAKEILNMYHTTRQKKNPHVYNAAPDQYKKVLYGLHGLYISHRKQDFNNSNEENEDDHVPKSINVHDVYHYIKNLPPNELRQLFYERMNCMLDNQDNTFLNRNCIYTMAQSTLMFKK